ncbi:MAG: carboxylesterase family protein [Candidatus Thorarchaeota archaeon]
MDKNVIIVIQYGKIQGCIEQGIKIFKGIPYTAPSVEDLSFKPPKPPKPWINVLKIN